MSEVDNKLMEVTNMLGIKPRPKGELSNFQQISNKNNIVAPKRVVMREFNPQSGFIEIVPIADPHIGHMNADVETLLLYRDYICANDDSYTILLGDNAETATKTSVGMAMYEEKEHIPEQLTKLYKIYKPLADRGKILGAISGNHEMRVAQLIGINPTELLAEKLNIPYLGYQGFTSLKVGEQIYDIVAFHGTGGGILTGSKINAAERLGRHLVVDLILTGHTHIRSVTEDELYEIKNGQIVPRHRYFVTCGSFLNYWNGYGEMKGLKPSPIGGVSIRLMANSKNIHITI